MTKEWKNVILEDLGFVGRGKSRHRPRNAEFLYGHEFPFVQTADVKAANFRINEFTQMYSSEGLKQSKLWPVNTLCVTIAANIADAALLGIEACFPDSVIGFIADDEKSDVRFVKYLFDLLQARIKKISQGAAQDNLSLEKLRTIKFLVPPLPTQRKIAAILSAYDDLIENNLKRIKLLEEQAQLTYEEWFVRLRFPGHETTPINTETGLPEGWEKVKLGEVIEISSSKRIFLSDYVETGIPFYRGKEIILKSKNASLTDRLYISPEKFNKIKSRFGAPQKGDLLITAVGTLGYPYLVTDTDGDFYFKDGNLIWFKGNKSISSIYLISCLKNSQFKKHLYNIAIGSSQKALTIKSLKGLQILKPNEKTSKSYDNLVEPILDSVECLQNQNQLLKEARDILLPRLMTGMIDVDKLDVPIKQNENAL